MPITLGDKITISSGDVDIVSISYASYLDDGETLTGTPTVTEVTTTDLTLSSKVVSTSELTILGETVAIGEAVQFTISGQVSGTTYRVRVTVSTTNGRTCRRDILVKTE